MLGLFAAGRNGASVYRPQLQRIGERTAQPGILVVDLADQRDRNLGFAFPNLVGRVVAAGRDDFVEKLWMPRG